MMRVFQILGALLLVAVGTGLWILRPVPPEQADTVDWDELQATLQHPDKIPISSQTNVVLGMVCTLRKDRPGPSG
ncbi:MAG: hypothetical protein H8D71_01305, partial [Deltaproteobacteria bacterium]|nr:hypothetical protein [Deltaproteobacteria bacterium]